MRNRVTPTGELVAVPLRGAWTGNRGCLHKGTSIVRFHRSSLWITCALSFRGWRLSQWAPGRFTVLFFHDEAVSFAAGHRPCALCRRDAYDAFRLALGEPSMKANELDRRLHRERIVRGTHRRRLHSRPWSELPAGAFIIHEDVPHLVRGDALVPWTVDGYGAPITKPQTGPAQLLTPPTSVAALVGGYAPQVDPSAAGL
jgi:hypothetical protein